MTDLSKPWELASIVAAVDAAPPLPAEAIAALNPLFSAVVARVGVGVAVRPGLLNAA